MILVPMWSHYETGVRAAPKWHQNSSHFVQKSFFSICYSLNPNLGNGNQRRLFSGNLPGMFSFFSSFSPNLVHGNQRRLFASNLPGMFVFDVSSIRPLGGIKLCCFVEHQNWTSWNFIANRFIDCIDFLIGSFQRRNWRGALKHQIKQVVRLETQEVTLHRLGEVPESVAASFKSTSGISRMNSRPLKPTSR